MTLEAGLAYFLDDPISSTLQLLVYGLMIGGPIWLASRYAKKRRDKKKIEEGKTKADVTF